MRQIEYTADLFRVKERDLEAKIALESEDQKLTFGELDILSNRVANALLDRGLEKGDRVAVLDKNSPHFVVLIGGIVKAGLVPVLVNFRLAASEVEYIVRDSKSKALFIGPEHSDMILALETKCPDLQVLTMETTGTGMQSLANLLARRNDYDPGLDHCGDDIVLQLYTSGTTGHPKGVCFTSDAYLKGAQVLVGKTGLVQKDDTLLIAMPLCHVAAYNTMMFALYQGVKSVIVRDILPETFLSLFARYQITTSLLAPAIIQLMMAHPKADEADFSSLRCMFYGSAPISEVLLEKARAVLKCDFCQLYGMTENGGVGTYLAPEDHDPLRGRLRSCGREYMPGTVRIADPDGHECAAGVTGEIQTQGDWMMAGYWNMPQLTNDSYVDGWFKTGDAAYRDEEGFIFIQDRIKDMIITGGENVYPVEVENQLVRHEAVAECAIFGIPDEKWGEAIKGVVVLKPDQSATEVELIDWLRDQITHFKIPKTIDFIEALPRNATGKVLKKDMRAPYWQGRKRTVG